MTNSEQRTANSEQCSVPDKSPTNILTGSLRDYLNTPSQDLFERPNQFGVWQSAREAAGYWPYSKALETPPLPEATLRYLTGESYTGINFSSQDYLGLSSHPAIKQAAVDAIEKFGVHSAGSSALAGNIGFADQLENSVGEMLQMEHILLYPTGWSAGYGVIRGLVRQDDYVVIDALAHNCLHEGANAATKKVELFKHLNIEHARKKLSVIRAKDTSHSIVVVIEGLYSMDSDVPDISAFQNLCREYNAKLVVDVAHDLGCSGPNGTGQIGLQDMLGKVDLVMGSFSKTFASNGGFVATHSKSVKDYLRCFSPSNTFSNALSPSQLAIISKAVEIIRTPEGEALRSKLAAAIEVLRTALTAQKLSVFGHPSPIVPVLLGREDIARHTAKLISEYGLLTNLVEFPAVSANTARLRMQVMATHTKEQCQKAACIVAQALMDAENYFAEKLVVFPASIMKIAESDHTTPHHS